MPPADSPALWLPKSRITSDPVTQHVGAHGDAAETVASADVKVDD